MTESDYFLNPIKPEKQLKSWVRQRYEGRCIYCDRPFDFLTCDHVIPITQGGHTAKYNLAPACTNCNRSKGHKEVFTWWRSKPFWSAEREELLVSWMEENRHVETEWTDYLAS